MERISETRQHALQERLGKPVVTSNQAVLWDLLDMVGHADSKKFISRAPALA